MAVTVRTEPIRWAPSTGKLYNSELQQRLANSGVKALGLYGQLLAEGEPTRR